MNVQTNPTDAELMRLIAAGNEEAFTTLYRRRQGGVYRFALQMSGSRTIAEDVTQEVFALVVREAGNYDERRGSVAAYLYGIARNYVRRCLQQENSREVGEASGPDSVYEKAVAADDLLGEMVRNEAIATVRSAVLLLPAHYREAVVLCDLHEMDYAEAAAVLACSIGTVRSRLHRGRHLLADRLRSNRRRGLAPGEVRPAGCVI